MMLIPKTLFTPLAKGRRGFSSQHADGAARHNQLLMKLYVFLWERHLMAAVAFGEGRLPRWYRGWKPLPQV
jgi:hypothetical protein